MLPPSSGRRLVPPHHRRPSSPVSGTLDPLLEALYQRLPDGDAGRAVEDFWSAVARRTTPLVHPLTPGRCLVTFLWREQRPSGVVVLHANRLFDQTDPRASVMRTVPGTDVRHLAFDLPGSWRGSYRFVLLDEEPPADLREDPAARVAFRQTAAEHGRPDPLNPRRAAPAPPSQQPASLAPLSLAELPHAPAQPWFARRDDVPAGPLDEHAVPSRSLGEPRRIWIHRPPGPPPADGYPLLVAFDGVTWVHHQPLRHTLDNLAADGAAPGFCTVFVDTLAAAARTRELACHPPFAAFVIDELIPFVTARYPVTTRADRSVVAGQSLGGLAAAYLAHLAPDRFGHVLSQSGGFWYPHYAGDEQPDPDAEWLTRRLRRAPAIPTRYYLEVGTMEWVSLPPNRRLRDVLTARGVEVRYVEFDGGHDTVCWRGGFADGLRWLTRDWPAAPHA